jgi:hypothetical protein
MTPAQYNEYQRQADVIEQAKKWKEEQEKKMTSIEWLKNWMTKNQYFIGNDLLVAFEQAKEMHKAEIIDAFWSGDNSDCTNEQNSKEFAEQYYQETFKNKIK